MAAATLVGEEAQEDEISLESEFIDLLTASERVGTLVDRIQDTACFQRYHPLLFGPCAISGANRAQRYDLVALLTRRRRQAVFDLATAIGKKRELQCGCLA